MPMSETSEREATISDCRTARLCRLMSPNLLKREAWVSALGTVNVPIRGSQCKVEPDRRGRSGPFSEQPVRDGEMASRQHPPEELECRREEFFCHIMTSGAGSLFGCAQPRVCVNRRCPDLGDEVQAPSRDLLGDGTRGLDPRR